MLSPPTLRLVLFVSCAHALVHVYELSLPSIEQELTAEFSAGKQVSGILGSCWRIPWGLGALGAGWLVDRFGSHRMLAVYLLGCAQVCILVASVHSLPLIFLSMFSMGAFASIYHPAGLALISHATTPQNRPYALGIHGIFGSLGIGGAPLLAGTVLSLGMDWREYYMILAVPGLILGLLFAAQWKQDRNEHTESLKVALDDRRADWRCYFTLTVVAMLCGVLYSSFLHFLTRYLAGVSGTWGILSTTGREQFFTGAVLVVGCFGQYLSGSIARARILEKQLAVIVLLQVPCLLWLGLATGPIRVFAASSFAFVHFMNQPVYNSLIAKYTPPRRRSLSYGFSFAAGLGVGGLGTSLAGSFQSDRLFYSCLASVALVAAGLCLVLVRWNQGERD